MYPSLIEMIQGQAFAWGFYNKVVLNGKLNCKENCVELNGYKWNLIQLIAHEETHCLQFHKFGIWKSNPVASNPKWKWEGYAEYVARQNKDQKDLYHKAVMTDFYSAGVNAALAGDDYEFAKYYLDAHRGELTQDGIAVLDKAVKAKGVVVETDAHVDRIWDKFAPKDDKAK